MSLKQSFNIRIAVMEQIYHWANDMGSSVEETFDPSMESYFVQELNDKLTPSQKRETWY